MEPAPDPAAPRPSTALQWVLSVALLWNGVVAIGSWCLTCGGVFWRLGGAGPAAWLIALLYIAGYLGIFWGTITLFRGAAGRTRLIVAGLKQSLIAATCWLLVAGALIVEVSWGRQGWRFDPEALIVAVPPVAILAMDGFLMLVLRPVLAREAAAAAADTTLDS